ERILSLMQPFYEMAVREKDACASERIAAATLCCKLEERLAFLLGLDHPTQARIDVYQVEQAKEPDAHEQIRNALFRVKYGPNWKPGDSFGANGKLLAHERDADDENRENQD